MTTEITDKIAKIDNTFILNAQYRMTAKEQKLLYYLISHLDPKNEKDFNIISVPIRQIEETLKESSKKWGSLYEEIDRLCGNMISKNITFPTDVTVEGKPLKGRINFFSAIKPTVAEDGQTLIEFEFSNNMKPFLLQLHHYVNIGVLEVVPMKNAHAIRMYSIFKSERDRMRGMVSVINMSYSMLEFKTMLGISDKYASNAFQNFKLNVLDKIRDEINENCPSMFVKYSYLKTVRKVTGISFDVYERKPAAGLLEQATAKKGAFIEKAAPIKKEKPLKADLKTYIPSENELATLTRAKLQAYNILKNYGIFEGIAYKQIIPKIKGSEFEGYEDFFVEKAILYFEKNAIQNTNKALKASTFVTWWTKNKVFEDGDVWADILEKLTKHKKQLQKTNPAAFENRIIAKNMTHNAFEEYIRQG